MKIDGQVVEFDGSVAEFLPAEAAPLAGKVLKAKPGTIFALGTESGYVVPRREFTLIFGRGLDEVHVRLGADDRYVSRIHGRLVCDGRDWWVHNEGNLPIQAGEVLLLTGHQMILPRGYTPLFIKSARGRSHLLETHVVDAFALDQPAGSDGHTEQPTERSEGYDLSPAERLVLVALAQRYLRGHENQPQPVSWQQVADDLNRAVPGQAWTKKKAEHIVGRVRKRLAGEIPYLDGKDLPQPVGNTLNHNLIQALLMNGSLRTDDLKLLADPD